jgi:hypothetical protein
VVVSPVPTPLAIHVLQCQPNFVGSTVVQDKRKTRHPVTIGVWATESYVGPGLGQVVIVNDFEFVPWKYHGGSVSTLQLPVKFFYSNSLRAK